MQLNVKMPYITAMVDCGNISSEWLDEIGNFVYT